MGGDDDVMAVSIAAVVAAGVCLVVWWPARRREGFELTWRLSRNRQLDRVWLALTSWGEWAELEQGDDGWWLSTTGPIGEPRERVWVCPGAVPTAEGLLAAERTLRAMCPADDREAL